MRYIAQHPAANSFAVRFAGGQVVRLTHGDAVEIEDWSRVSNAARVRPWLLPEADFEGDEDTRIRLSDLTDRGLRKIARELDLETQHVGRVELINNIASELEDEGLELFVAAVSPGFEVGETAETMTGDGAEELAALQARIAELEAAAEAAADGDGEGGVDPFEGLDLTHLNKGGLVQVATTLGLDASGSADDVTGRIDAELSRLTAEQ